eukprot:162931-Rhodomonas_salina.1
MICRGRGHPPEARAQPEQSGSLTLPVSAKFQAFEGQVSTLRTFTGKSHVFAVEPRCSRPALSSIIWRVAQR